jgi:hypothetical protein
MAPKTMKRYVVKHRNAIDGLELQEDVPVPELRSSTDVSATLTLRIREGGYGQDTNRMGREDKVLGDWDGWDIAITSPHDSVSSVGAIFAAKERVGLC